MPRYLVTFHPLVIDSDSPDGAAGIALLCDAVPCFRDVREATNQEAGCYRSPSAQELRRALPPRSIGPGEVMVRPFGLADAERLAVALKASAVEEPSEEELAAEAEGMVRREA